MTRQKVVAVLLAVLSLWVTLYWELLLGPALVTQSDPMHMLTLPVGLCLAGLQEVGHRGSPLQARVRRVRGLLYLWQAIVALADFIASIGVAFELNQLHPDFPLFPGAVQALHCFYLAMTFDLIVLRPVELWIGSDEPASKG